MFSNFTKKYFFLISFSFIIFISSINSLILNEEVKNFENQIPLIKEPSNIKESYNFFRQLAYSCATTSYDKKEIQEECNDGPSSYSRVLKYNTFSSYISDFIYH